MRPGETTRAKPGTGSPSGALALLDATLPGKPGAAELDAALHATNSVVRDLFAAFAPAASRKGLLGDGFDPERVLKLRGDPARGLAVMRRDGGPNCLGCHQLGAEGRAFGPEVSAAGRKYDDARLLGEIVEPSRTVAPENALHVLELADGTTLAGLVSPADDGRVRVRDASGQDRVLGRSDIRKDERQGLSAMPEGLLSNLTAREAADILAAIRQAK